MISIKPLLVAVSVCRRILLEDIAQGRGDERDVRLLRSLVDADDWLKEAVSHSVLTLKPCRSRRRDPQN